MLISANYNEMLTIIQVIKSDSHAASHQRLSPDRTGGIYRER